MRKKLEGNGLWESSRMMLPEHRVRINKRMHEELRQSKPELDEQEMEIVAAAIRESMVRKAEVAVSVFDPFESRNITGIVTKFDRERFRMDVKEPDGTIDWEWFEFKEVLKAEVKYDWVQEEMIDQ